MGYPVPGPRSSYPAFNPQPPKNVQPAQPPPTQSPVTLIMCTLLSMVYWLFKTCWLTHTTCTCFKELTLLLNMHLICFVNIILCPKDKYMFKINNEKIRLICWLCSKLKLNTTWYCSGVFIVDFDQSQYVIIVILLLTLNKHLSVGCERQVIVLKTQKVTYSFCNKCCKACFIKQFIIAPNWNKLWTNDHTLNILQGRRKLFYGGGGGGGGVCVGVGGVGGRRGGGVRLSKNFGHHGWPATKNKKKHWLKRPKAVPENEISTKICMI